MDYYSALKNISREYATACKIRSTITIDVSSLVNLLMSDNKIVPINQYGDKVHFKNDINESFNINSLYIDSGARHSLGSYTKKQLKLLIGKVDAPLFNADGSHFYSPDIVRHLSYGYTEGQILVKCIRDMVRNDFVNSAVLILSPCIFNPENYVKVNDKDEGVVDYLSSSMNDLFVDIENHLSEKPRYTNHVYKVTCRYNDIVIDQTGTIDEYKIAEATSRSRVDEEQKEKLLVF